MKILALGVFWLFCLMQAGCRKEATALLIEFQSPLQITGDRSEITIRLTNTSAADLYLPKYFTWVKFSNKSIICKTDHYYFNQFIEEDLDQGLMNTFFHLPKESKREIKFDFRQNCFDLADGAYEVKFVFPVSNEAVREYALNSYVLTKTKDHAEKDYLASQIEGAKKGMNTEHIEKYLTMNIVGFPKKK